jgi:DNA-binding NarL/FixJ family response regulator
MIPVTPSSHAPPIRVLVADDHETVLWGLCQLVESAKPRFDLRGRAKTADELLNHEHLSECDVVVVDLGMTRRNSMDVIETLVSKNQKRVVVLTGSLDPITHRDAIRRGARGLVLKSEPADSLLQAIEAVQAGLLQVNPDVSSSIARLGLDDTAASPDLPNGVRPKRGVASLTPKELDVIVAVVRNRSAKALVAADALGISEHTLRNHLTTIYSKLGLGGKIDLYDFALKHGIVKGDLSSPGGD